MRIKKLFFEYAYLAILGFVAFSRLGQYLLVDVLSFRFYLIEIFFIPYFICQGSKYIKYLHKLKNKPIFAFFIFITIFDILMGSLYTFDPINVITMTRSFVYIVFVALIFKEKGDFSIYKLFIISLAAIMGEMYYGFFIQGDSLRAINLTCLALSIIIPVIMNKYFMFIISSLLSFVVSISSGYRIGIVLTLLVVFECIVWLMFNNYHRKTLKVFMRKYSVVLVFGLLLVFIAINYKYFVELIGDIFGMNQYKIYRVTEKLEGFFRLNISQSQDTGRVEKFSLVFSEFGNHIIPTGLIYKSLGKLGQYIDVPILWLYGSLGSIGTVILLSTCIPKGIKSFFNAFKKDTPSACILCGLMFPVMLLFLLINGNFLYLTYQCILTGIIVGVWYSRRIM